MIANLVNQKVSSSTPTEITLGDVSPGFIGLSSVFTNGQLVFYTVQDGKNKEVGLAQYNQSTSSLVREFIYDKLDNGTYTQNPTTGLSLTDQAIVTVSPSVQALTTHLDSWGKLEATPVSGNDNAYTSMPTYQLLTNGIKLPYFAANQEDSIPLIFTLPFDLKQDSNMFLNLNYIHVLPFSK